VHCAQPGANSLTLKKRHGRIIRQIDVPLCAPCAQEMQRKSGAEERLEKTGWVIGGAVALLLLVMGLFLTPAGLPFWLRLVVGFVIGVGGGTAVFTFFRRLADTKALPAKQAIRQSAQLSGFSWRAATFQFTNETFSERFRELNQPLLMEMSN
jgi:hypothetical protein